MEFQTFSFEDAVEICDDFSDLVDTEFKLPNTPMVLVEHVVVCPAGGDSRSLFISKFLESKDPEVSLKFFQGEEYGVIIITTNNQGVYHFIDILDYVREKGLNYNFPGSY